MSAPEMAPRMVRCWRAGGSAGICSPVCGLGGRLSISNSWALLESGAPGWRLRPMRPSTRLQSWPPVGQPTSSRRSGRLPAARVTVELSRRCGPEPRCPPTRQQSRTSCGASNGCSARRGRLWVPAPRHSSLHTVLVDPDEGACGLDGAFGCQGGRGRGRDPLGCRPCSASRAPASVCRARKADKPGCRAGRSCRPTRRFIWLPAASPAPASTR